ncbi:UDP-3-O-acyl-N-acetylglucosamine deacetylase, partial [Patescibacteria group bacterium]
MSAFKIVNHKKQTTLKKSFSIHGYSMNINKKVYVECLPAKAGTGIVFILNNQSIKVDYENYKKTKLHTTILANKNVCVKTVEHVLSAFYGMNIDNVIINIHGDNQLPLLDGSSYVYAQKILKAGIRYLSQDRKVIKVIRPYIIKSKNKNMA